MKNNRRSLLYRIGDTILLGLALFLVWTIVLPALWLITRDKLAPYNTDPEECA